MIEDTGAETFGELSDSLFKNAEVIIKGLVNLPKEKRDELMSALGSLVQIRRALEKVEKLKNAYVNVSKEYLNAARKLHELKEAYNKTGQSNTELAKKRVVADLLDVHGDGCGEDERYS